jgi:Fe-S-cluster containining protein
MISKISGMRQAQLQNSFISDNNDLSQWQYIIFSDAENMNKFKGIMFKKLYIEDFCMKYSRNDLCFCGSGKKYKNCHSDINPNSLVAHQYRIMHLLDEEIKNCPYTICQKGCSDCCTDDFEVSVTEFFTILNYLQIHCNNQQIENICKLSKVKISSILSNEKTIAFSRCIFLNEHSNACEIYEVRPIICRKYGYYSNTTDCSKIISDKKASMSLLKNTEVDTSSNILSFILPNNTKLLQKSHSLIYWFSRVEQGKLSSNKMNDLYRVAVNSPTSEYIRILQL